MPESLFDFAIHLAAISSTSPSPGNRRATKARLGGRILSEGLAQLAAATWMQNPPGN